VIYVLCLFPFALIIAKLVKIMVTDNFLKKDSSRISGRKRVEKGLEDCLHGLALFFCHHSFRIRDRDISYLLRI